MSASINRRVASCVFRDHRASKGIFVTIKLLCVAERPTFLSLQERNIRPIGVLVGGYRTLDFRLQFPPIKTKIDRIEE